MNLNVHSWNEVKIHDFMNRRWKKLPIILKQIWKQIELFICDAKLKSQQVPPETYFSGP